MAEPAKTVSHVTVVEKAPGGFKWKCCCGAESETDFPRRQRAVRAGNWHVATVGLFIDLD